MSGHPGVKLMIAFFRPVAVAAVAASMLASCGAALALDTVRLGKAVPNSFAFGAAEVGVEAKIFRAEGLDAADHRASAAMPSLSRRWRRAASMSGSAPGPGLGFRVKGAPAIGVAAMYGPPANLACGAGRVVDQDIADLKGKRIGVTTVGSLTDWLVRELSQPAGLGPQRHRGRGARRQMQARLAAMDRGELDGMVLEAANGYELEEAGRTRNLLLFGDIVKHFYTHVIFATDDMSEKRPDLLRRFLRGWFKTIAFMKANREFTVASEASARSTCAAACRKRSTTRRCRVLRPTAPGTRWRST